MWGLHDTIQKIMMSHFTQMKLKASNTISLTKPREWAYWDGMMVESLKDDVYVPDEIDADAQAQLVWDNHIAVEQVDFNAICKIKKTIIAIPIAYISTQKKTKCTMEVANAINQLTEIRQFTSTDVSNMAEEKLKGGKKATKDSGASVLHMNHQPIKVVALKMDIAKETQKLDALVANASCDPAEHETLTNFNEPEEIIKLKIADADSIIIASGQHHLTMPNKYSQSLKGLLHDLEKWTFIIYDEDKLLTNGTAPTNYLSHNSTLHEYKETEEEVLVTILKKLKAVHTAQEKNARLHKVLHHEGLCVMLAMRLMPLAYVTPLSTYHQRVVKTLQDVWELTDNEDFEENAILYHLDHVVAYVALYLTPQEEKRQAPLPLLGEFVMDITWELFIRIQKGITEVSHWFETLLNYYQMLHLKTHIMDNWSTLMLGNIDYDTWFLSGGSTSARRGLMQSHNRSHMTTPTHLDGSVDEPHDEPQAMTLSCIGDKKELTSIYDKLPSSEALLKILQLRQMKSNKNRNLVGEGQSIADMMAFHIIAWSWLSPTLKNTARDIKLCLKTITVECQYSDTNGLSMWHKQGFQQAQIGQVEIC
ncbi:hypothetical protein CY34DRAFT_107948 [Suillus luteus UH-Slu-Lm8-n1]|uniref:Uncharacterized protein n=1 Tax=Suillus luteus UH-Slu-Lm8-n1 TaxID=930992 RepID=A0A0D0B8I8_9AGAM|nr:hypothetical protein CY34DRAFT_107948 [Suillus luteus UH-Slu-Lm8-n1]